MKQIYETTVFDPETRLYASFITVPARSFSSVELLNDIQKVAADLRLQLIASVPAFALHDAFKEIFQRNGVGFAEDRTNVKSSIASGAVDEFIDYLSYADYVPYEGSPLETIALATLLARTARKSPGAAVGAFIGYEIAGDPHSLMIIVTTGAGLIIGGATDTIQRVFNDQGRKLLERLLEYRAEPQPKKRGRKRTSPP